MRTDGIASAAMASTGGTLDEETVQKTLKEGLAGRFTGQRLLVLIPDHTRTVPLPMLFRMLASLLGDTSRLDFMVALGTHPPLADDELRKLVGITEAAHAAEFRHIRLLNHAWKNPSALQTIGTITTDEIRRLAGSQWHPSLAGDVPVRINRAALEYDHILILGPTFPHEVAGFSGGAKYLFPGISGEEMIDKTHWLGALAGVVGTIGIASTPVRAMIDLAASKLETPVTLAALIVVGDALAGIHIGDLQSAWQAAAAQSAERHIRWMDQPFRKVLSWAPPMYDELWTGAKAMYKLEPVVAEGGELIIYAPHLDTVSRVHGKYIYEIGYHILPYFLQDWERYSHIPLGVLAHSTHVRGSGKMVAGEEKPNVRVTLASRIPPEDCDRLNLGYANPDEIHPEDWKGKEEEGILFIPKAGEILYRLKN